VHFPRYWAKASTKTRAPDGRELAFSCWRGSDASVADAEAAARGAAASVAERAARGEPLRSYAYGERDLREEVLQRVDGSAAVTRNAFGCLVLNTARAMFVDVDLPPATGGGSLSRLWKRLVGGSEAPSDPAAQALARLEAWVAARPGSGFRIYRTYGGLRYLATAELFEPGSAEAEAALAALGCDPLYVRLCRAQKSFRARLTPKPWRCGLGQPPSRYPHESAERAEAFRAWLAGYEVACASLATCAYVTSVGSDRVHPDVAPLVTLHDEATRSASGLAIA
jgi:hypothetical protein